MNLWNPRILLGGVGAGRPDGARASCGAVRGGLLGFFFNLFTGDEMKRYFYIMAVVGNLT